VAVLIVGIVVLSGALGFAAQRHLRRRGGTDGQAAAEGVRVDDLLGPVRTLVALLLAFVLVQTFSSYQDASDAAGDEAGAVSAQAQAAALLPAPVSVSLVASLRCYARAVAGPGWASLERTRHTSPIVDQAEAKVEDAVAQAERLGANDAVMTQVLTANHDRAAARRVRLAEATSSVPDIVTALLVGSVALTVAATAALADRRIRPSLRWGLLGLTALIYTASLLVIFDLDRPFGGVAAIKPTAMRAAEQQIGATPLGANPPCDASGAGL
jgi:Protein of unknown function (DUF4239)